MSKMTITCPQCRRTMTAPGDMKQIACPHCGLKFVVGFPEPPRRQPDNQFAGLDAGVVIDDVADDVGSDPWYYRFLWRYVTWVMVFTIFLAVLAAGLFVYVFMDTIRSQTVYGFIAICLILLGIASVVIGTLFWGSLILLLVDMGRSLRALRKRKRR